MRGLTDLALEQWIKSAIIAISLENIEVKCIMNAVLNFANKLDYLCFSFLRSSVKYYNTFDFILF